ncbi:MAG: S41 family peptidase [Acidimicrobiia bacterium]|nr:S41 family peptidase [Acidimicrobiia bacterium]MDH4307979.1 S41 family peptidase [Acidimicrobiia bacterium]MDH5292402.1 S41 family peptidase [Acidimicrobiia bacterium]
MNRLLVAGVVLLGACAQPATVDTTTTTAAVPVTTAPPRVASAPQFETVPCSSTPPVAFAVLCEAFEDIVDGHVDGPEPGSLAAAAALGVDQLEFDGAETLGDFECVVPHESFESLCQAIARRGLERPAPLDELVTAAVRGMFRYGLDPFSVYIPGSDVDVDFDGSGLVIEIGVIVSGRDQAGAVCSPLGGGCRFEVVSVFDFSAAAKGGIGVGDAIVEVDGRAVEGLAPAEATALLAGAPGTEVEIVVVRDGASLTRTLTREDIRFVPTEWDQLEGGYAYFRMNDFSQQAAIDLGAFLQSDVVAGSSGLVLDLRDNPGGLILAAQAVASQFLDGGLVMVERGREYSDEIPVVDGGLARTDLDVAVLVNRGSASASEIVAAVLQERGRAVVVGEPTFGKNLVQWVSESRDGGQLRISIARWETPAGRDIGIRGLEPDVVVRADPNTDVDEVLEAALDVLS